MNMNESIMDFPKDQLAPEVWTQDDPPQLTDEAEHKLQSIVDWAKQTLKIPVSNIHIIGSITSNSYSAESDIDLHFCSDKIKSGKAEAFNDVLKTKFGELIEGPAPELSAIGEYPIQVYFQEYPLYDVMSVGCYDFINHKWIVGPEMKDSRFNPYSEYYKADMKYVQSLISDIRDTILKVNEQALLVSKIGKSGTGTPEYTDVVNQLVKSLKESSELFDAIRKARTVLSPPKTLEDALKKRKSAKRHIADSAVKLLGKFGYLSILYEYSSIYDQYLEDESSLESNVPKISEIVSSSLANTQLLGDSDQIDEGVGKWLAGAALAGTMGMGALTPNDVDAAPVSNITMTQTATKSDLKKYGGWSKQNAINILATTIWCEAGNQSYDGKMAVASVLHNRAGGDVSKLVAAALKPNQFSEWNPGNQWKLVRPKSNSEWTLYKPSYSSKSWDDCVEIAKKLITTDFKSTIGNRNMISNPKKDNSKALDSWGKSCDKTVGSHVFGYQKDQDGWLKAGKKCPYKDDVYVVQAGDTLSKIAKSYKTTVDELVKKNNIKNKNSIKIGQEIKV